MVRSIAFPISLLVAGALALGGCAATGTSTASGAWQTLATATLRNAGGVVVGTAELRNRRGNWQLALGISGQSPGERAIHLHQVGACDAPDFASAKGHLNPAGKAHGSANPAGMHLGDLPNLAIGPDGAASTLIALADDLDLAQVFDADGTSIVVHGGPDDYRTDPAGNSGPRVACGILTRAG